MRTELVGTHGQQATACPDSGVAYINHPGAGTIQYEAHQPASAAVCTMLLAAACDERHGKVQQVQLCLPCGTY